MWNPEITGFDVGGCRVVGGLPGRDENGSGGRCGDDGAGSGGPDLVAGGPDTGVSGGGVVVSGW